jgi:ribosomal-protein-alanine N-acetyltransferase
MMLETPRLLFRPFKESDTEAVHGWFSDPEVFRFYTYGPYLSLEKTAERISQYMAHLKKYGFAKNIVIEKSTGLLIGDAGLSFAEDIGEVDVGYKFARSHWGKGYATEAAQAWVRYGFDQLGLERIVAIVHPQNVRSKRVVEKLQFSFSRYKREDGVEFEIYQRLRTEYRRDSTSESRR